MPLVSRNPANGETVATHPEMPMEEVVRRLQKADEAFRTWRTVSFAERAKPMKKLAALLRERAREGGELASKEMGKPIKAAVGELEKCATCCEYYAEHAERILSPESAPSDAKESYVRFDPLGVVLAVMPWNFPYWQVVRFLAPALMAGNAGVLKHASNVQGCAAWLEKQVVDAGFPEGLFANLPIGSAHVEAVIRHPVVKAVTLTGSEPAGRAVASQAGSEIKKVVLELGGSDPFIVLADADIDQAAKVAVTARLQNCGQSCIAAKRFIVVESVANAFIAKMKEGFEAAKVGDPMDEATFMGPLANASMRDDIERQVAKSVEMGAELVTGGKRLGSGGFFYAPTILSHVRKGMPAYDEELFGPVASMILAKDDADAIRLANDTDFGLGASVWTKDAEKGKRVAAEIESGCVFVNAMVKSDPRLPFGGIKRSGYGRELSHYGIKEFVNVKTVYVA